MADEVPPPPPGFPGASQTAGVPPPPPFPPAYTPAPGASKTKNMQPEPPKEPYDAARIAQVESSSDAPLPANWSQHSTSEGVSYYWHAIEGTSTWIRPGVAIRPPEGARIDPKTGQMVLPPPKPVENKKPKKEKPREKEPVEGTDWVRVTTTEDNVFYMNKATKTSVWSCPEELKEWEEARTQRIQQQKRKAQDEAAADVSTASPSDAPKPPKKKKPKTVHSLAEMQESDPELAKRLAEELKAEQEHDPSVAEMQKYEAEQKAKREKESELTSDENKAMFKALLGEKDINPMAPWDMELPKFVADPRYAAVKLLRERRALFDEFCKDKIREQRSKRKDQPKLDPAAAYRALLRSEITSTRQKWDDFRQSFKKDNRFREYGRDDREREKAFKTWLRELGEIKRADAQQADDKFTAMLSESLGHEDASSLGEWKDVRQSFKEDPRFEAVKSGTRRQELYDQFTKTLKDKPANGGKEDKAKRAQASLAAREEAVKKQQQEAERHLNKSKAGADRQEAEREFKSLLIDAVRSSNTRWREVEPTLTKDPRFHLPGLTDALRTELWDAHIHSLGARRQGSLEDLFERVTAVEAGRLDIPFRDVWPKIESDAAIKHLHKGMSDIRDMYEDWLDHRVHVRAKQDLEDCMRENSFVEYWGRLKRDRQSKEEKGIEEEGQEDDTEMVDVKQMSQKIDVNEMAAVLKHDKRFQVLNYDPQRRERWMREFLETLTAPKQTVYQQS